MREVLTEVGSAFRLDLKDSPFLLERTKVHDLVFDS
jgi:hypothetical protein